MKDIRNKGIEEITADLLKELPDEVYITIDMDVMDPSIMPAVGTPEPGGLSWEMITQLLRDVIESRKVIGIDLTELCPISGLVAPEFIAARLLYRIFACIASKDKGKSIGKS